MQCARDQLERVALSKVLVISNDRVNKKMGGTAIRYWEFARMLSRWHDVTLAVPNETDLASSSFFILRYNLGLLKKAIQQTDIVVAQRLDPLLLPLAVKLRKPLAVDLYSPYPIESLSWLAHRNLRLRTLFAALELSMARLQLHAGDFFMCANERQRDFWIGALMALGRITPRYYDRDPNLLDLIGIVPFGMPAVFPRHTRAVLKGVDHRIQATDTVLIWNGGLWSWMDPLTLIRAMAEVSCVRKDIKLFFMGGKNPNPNLFQMSMADRAVQLSRELNLLDKVVVFNENWIPYEERHNYLLESDIGISIHPCHVETRFSYRTRVLDCIWTHLPSIVSDGDATSTLIAEKGLGVVVRSGDVHGLARAILDLADNPETLSTFRENNARTAGELTWEKVSVPLQDFCGNPRVLRDKSLDPGWLYASGVVHYMRRGFLEMKMNGVRKAFERIYSRIFPVA